MNNLKYQPPVPKMLWVFQVRSTSRLPLDMSYCFTIMVTPPQRKPKTFPHIRKGQGNFPRLPMNLGHHHFQLQACPFPSFQ